MNKRAGFKTRFLQNTRITNEKFDTVFGTFPNKLYILTDESGKYAITGEAESDYIVIKPVDKKNKYQWVLVEADSGTICFFTDLKNYMSITISDEGIIHVKRNDILKNGSFVFNSDKTISMKDGFSDYCLAFRKHESFAEFFNPETDTPLEVVHNENIDSSYSNKWKFELVYDLRELTDYMDVKEDIEKVNASGNAQVKALQDLMNLNKKQYEADLAYRDNKINYYENNWFIKLFYKKD